MAKGLLLLEKLAMNTTARILPAVTLIARY